MAKSVLYGNHWDWKDHDVYGHHGPIFLTRQHMRECYDQIKAFPKGTKLSSLSPLERAGYALLQDNPFMKKRWGTPNL